MMRNGLLYLLFVFVFLFAFQVKAQYTVVPQTGHNNVIVALEYSPDGKYLATAGHDFKVLLWDTKTGIHFPLYSHSTVVDDVEFSPDSKYLVSSDQGGNTYVWDVISRKVVNKIITNDESQALHQMQFISNEEIALLTDKMFKTWNFKTNTYPEKIPLKATKFALNKLTNEILLLENTSDYSSTGGFTNTSKMILFDRIKKAPVADQWIRAIGEKWLQGEFSASGKHLLLIQENEMVLLDYKSKKKVWSTPLSIQPQKVIITPDETKIICSGDFENPSLMVFEFSNGKKIQERAQFTDFQFAYNHQQQLIAGAHDVQDFITYPISIYDLKAQTVIRTIYPNNYYVTKLAWNDAAKHLYVYSKDKSYVWDLTMGSVVDSKIEDFDKEISTWKKGTVKSGFNAKSPSEKFYAVTNENLDGVKVFNSDSKQQIFTSANKISRVAFSNDDKLLYCISPDDLTVFNISNGSIVNQLHYDKGSLSSIALSIDGKALAIGKYWNEGTEIKEKYYTTDYKVDIIDPTSLKIIKQLEGHTSNVIALDFTGDGKYLVSGSMDGSTRFWDVSNGQQKALLYGESPNDYFIQGENGYYSSSKSSIDKIAFDYKGVLMPGKLFETQMNRPDKVVESLGYSSPKIITALKKAFEKRIAQLGISEQQLKVDDLPQLNVSDLPAPSVSTKQIQVNYEAVDNLNELNHIKLLINNIPVYGRKGLSVKNKKAVKGKLDIELTEGLNTIELSVVNAKGSSSLPVSFTVFCTIKTKPDLYLITIGIDKFLDQEYNLNYAAKDANDIAVMFESKKSNYGKLVHLPFRGIQATKDNILGVRTTLSQTKPDDQVIVFVATHGLLDEKYDYYLATYNMMFDKPEFNGLAYNELEGLLDEIPARKKLILLDACHSGEVDANEITASTSAAINTTQGVKARGFKPVKKVSSIGLENSFDLMKHMFADLREGTGTTVIASAAGVEFAIESDEWNNGAFTAALLEGIKTKKADGNSDANITIGELKKFVFDRVIEITNGKQHPTSRIDNIDNDFVILSTVASSITLLDLSGKWTPTEIDQLSSGKFEKIQPGHNRSNMTISKGVDGNYYLSYGSGDIKLTREDTNSYGGPGGWTVKGEYPTTLVMYDSYMGNTRYKKVN